MADGWRNTSLEQLDALADRYGTPFFLYDADLVNERVRNIRATLENVVEVFYAVKANPNLALLRAVRGTVDGLDISSEGELDQATLAGFGADKLSFAGPAKTTSDLTRSIGHRVGSISIESLRELNECVEIAKRLDTRANVALRVNPLLINRSFGIKMGGRPIQFGIDEEEIATALRAIVTNQEYLNFQGLHVYVGSQCFDAEGIVDGVRNTLRIAKDIEANTPLVCKTVNLGGGFGVSHSEGGRELDLVALAQQLVPILQAFHRSAPSRRILVFELGRYLTADAGVYVSRVVSRKPSRGKEFLMVDGGLHHHLAAAGTFGAAFRSNYVLVNLSRPDRPKITCSVAGPSCNPTDLLGVDVQLGEPDLGDLIAVLGAGSYGFTASPLLFLGRRTAAEIVRIDDRFILARPSRPMTDFN